MHGLCFVWSIVIRTKKVNPSTPQPEGQGLRASSKRRFLTQLKGVYRRQTGQPK